MSDTDTERMNFDSARFLKNIMTFNTSSPLALNWELYKALYYENASAFVINGDLHQNSINDHLHLSVSLNLPNGRMIPLHFNGYWRNHFRCCNVTRQELDGSVSIIAVFGVDSAPEGFVA